MDGEQRAIVSGIALFVALVAIITFAATWYQVDKTHNEKVKFSNCVVHNMQYNRGNCTPK